MFKIHFGKLTTKVYTKGAHVLRIEVIVHNAQALPGGRSLPIVLSEWLPFTILAALCIVVAIALCVYLIRVEDRFNLKKWGKEYRQYMAEVPAVNVVKGLLKAARS